MSDFALGLILVMWGCFVVGVLVYVIRSTPADGGCQGDCNQGRCCNCEAE